MFEAKQIIGFVSVGISCLSFLFCILALLLENWIVEDTGLESAGLWQRCIAGICVPYPTSLGYIHAVRALVFLGLFSMLGATAMTIIHVFLAKDNIIFMYASVALAAVAGLLLMIGFAIFDENSKGFQFGPGFALCIVAWLFAWIVAVLNDVVVCIVRKTVS